MKVNKILGHQTNVYVPVFEADTKKTLLREKRGRHFQLVQHVQIL